MASVTKARGGKESKAPVRFPPRRIGLIGPAIILMAAVIAAGPLLLRGPSCSSDFTFHFISWIDAEHSMAMGIPYPHWANSPNFGAGEPKFVFYPPITWMGGAVLGMLLPWLPYGSSAFPIVYLRGARHCRPRRSAADEGAGGFAMQNAGARSGPGGQGDING
jgi:hypothetical protein